MNDLFAQNVTHQSLYCKEDCVSAKLVDECLFSNTDSDHCSKIPSRLEGQSCGMRL